MTTCSPSKVSAASSPLLAGLFLFAVALALRWVGIDSGLPHIGEPDPYIVKQADVLRQQGLTDRHMAGWRYPHLVGTIAAALPFDEATPGPEAPLDSHLEAASAKRIHVRRVTGFLSALVAPGTFLVALRLLGFRWAFLAGLIAATSLLQLCFSCQARPHGPVAGMAAMATWLCIRYAERPSFPRAGAMGLGCALSLSTLHTGAAALGPMGAAVLLALRGAPGRRLRALAMGTFAAAIVGAIGAWFYVRAEDGYGTQKTRETFTLDGSDEVGAKLLGTIWMNGHALPAAAFTGEGVGVFALTMRDFDPVLGILAILGALVSLRFLLKPRSLSPAAWCLLAFTVPTFVVLCGYSLSFSRFFLIVILPLSIAGAAGARALTQLPKARGLGTGVAAAGCGLMLFVAAKFAWLRTQPDSHTEAAVALEQAGLAEAVIHSTNVRSFPRFVDPAYLPKYMRWEGHPWDRYQLDLDGRSGGTKLKIVGLQQMGKMFASPNPEAAVRASLKGADAALVALSPRRGRRLFADRWDALRDHWLDALSGPDWETLAEIPATTGEPTYATGHWISLRTLLVSKRLGPSIAVFRRVSD